MDKSGRRSLVKHESSRESSKSTKPTARGTAIPSSLEPNSKKAVRKRTAATSPKMPAGKALKSVLTKVDGNKVARVSPVTSKTKKAIAAAKKVAACKPSPRPFVTPLPPKPQTVAGPVQDKPRRGRGQSV
jgi:hypothetical protein